MKLYNSLSGRLEPFEPQGEAVRLYVCGITPYDTTHLGHAFTYALADVLVRYLESQGRRVNYVQNVTDIDDDILRKAQELDQDWRQVGDRWTAHYIEDMQALNVRPPDHFPRATDVIAGIIQTVQKLLEAGVAYERSGSVYFDLSSWGAYGQLSRLSPEEMLPIANERGNNPDDPNKKSPLDFVLWQAQAPGEPAWDSPWGPGRPGWHIECSTMATDLLGDTLDIHLGGEDLIFPHHESEIAQVEPLTGGQPFVRNWMHVAMVRHEGQKMSKSLGNLVMVRDLLKEWTPDAVRLYLAMHHYRHPWEHSDERLKDAAGMAAKMAEAASGRSGQAGEELQTAPTKEAFSAAMDEDLDTPQAIQALDELADKIIAAVQKGWDVSAAQSLLRRYAGVLGLRLGAEGPEQRVVTGWKEHLKRFAGVPSA